MILPEYSLEPRAFLTWAVDGPVVPLFVWAEAPVNVYLVNSRNLRLYRKRVAFVHHGPGTVQMYSSAVRLPRAASPWHVVLENPTGRAVRVAANVK